MIGIVSRFAPFGYFIILILHWLIAYCNIAFFSTQSKYSKNYPNETEENRRMAIFLDNKNKTEQHNQLFEKGLVTYEQGLNKYSDLTADEFRNRMNGFRASPTLG